MNAAPSKMIVAFGTSFPVCVMRSHGLGWQLAMPCLGLSAGPVRADYLGDLLDRGRSCSGFSREIVLNEIARHSLGPPKSY